MQAGELSEVVAIASRNLENARNTAADLGIPAAYGSYEELLQDENVEAIYNPLPNHLHVSWSIKAAEAGKHVLCEKPISLDAAECRALIAARDRTGVRIGEAFMVRTHPQWIRVRELVRSGEIGDLRLIQTDFSFFNRDPQNIRSVPEWGGGALMDIGCYPIQISRFLFEQDPVKVSGTLEIDPELGVDRLTSGILHFSSGQSVFSCSTQLVYHQRVQVFGTKGRIEIEIPFNAPPDRPCRIFVDPGTDVFGTGTRMEELAVCNQYTIQGDEFSRAIREGGQVPTPLEDSLSNMRVIDALVQSSREEKWVALSDRPAS